VLGENAVGGPVVEDDELAVGRLLNVELEVGEALVVLDGLLAVAAQQRGLEGAQRVLGQVLVVFEVAAAGAMAQVARTHGEGGGGEERERENEQGPRHDDVSSWPRAWLNEALVRSVVPAVAAAARAVEDA